MTSATGDFEFHVKSAARCVRGADSAAVQVRDTVGDCQAQSYAARLAITRIRNSVERSKDVCQF